MMTHPDDPVFSSDRGVKGKSEEARLNFPEVMGLTKREYFAAVAMQGLLAGDHSSIEFHSTQEARDAAAERVQRIGWASTSFADAVIAELNKEIK